MKNVEDLISLHESLLAENAYCYFELAYTRQTSWMAWLCSSSNPTNRNVLASGQGSSADEAAKNALADWASRNQPQAVATRSGS